MEKLYGDTEISPAPGADDAMTTCGRYDLLDRIAAAYGGPGTGTCPGIQGIIGALPRLLHLPGDPLAA